MSKKQALLILNGEPPKKVLFEKLWDQVDLKICADGGAKFVLDQDLLPDKVIGDLDSLSAKYQKQLDPERLLHVFEQDTNDGDKALRYCVKQNVQLVHILGGSGIRTDQFLANLELLLKYESNFSIYFWTDLERILVISDEWQEFLPIGITVSLIPLFGPATGIKTTGLAYPLNDENLIPAKSPSGISNKVISSPVKVTIKEGKLLCIIQLTTW